MIPFIPNPAEKVVVLTVITTTSADNHLGKNVPSATHPIHFAADSPDKIHRCAAWAVFFFSGKLYLESFISRLNVIPCHDLTLSVGEPDNAAAKQGQELRSE